MASVSVHTIVASTLVSYLAWAVAISNNRFHRVWSLALCLFDLTAVAVSRASSLWETIFLLLLVAILAGVCFLLSPFYAFFQKKRPYASKSLNILWPRDGESSKDDVLIDIVAVHGLASNPESAWDIHSTKASSSSVHHVWLKESLPEDVPQARIMAFNHNTAWQADALGKSIKDHGKDLLRALRRVRKEHNRPIVFIGHSFGGLLVKQALINANEDRTDEFNDGIISNTRGFLFLGVPHRGSPLTFLGELAATLGYWNGSNTNLLEILRPGSDANGALSEGFNKILQNGCGPKNTVCVFESVRESFCGLPIIQVVSKESAVIDGSEAIGFDRRHRGLQRMDPTDNEYYQDLAHWVKRWAGDAVRKVKASSDLTPTTKTDEQSASIQSLAFPEMRQREYDVIEEASKTCLWIFDDTNYIKWQQRRNGLLWIKGKPGAGKSTLMKHIVRAKENASQELVFSYFITGQGADIQKTPIGVYRALLHQIFDRYPQLCSEFASLYQARQGAVGKYGDEWTWHESEVKTYLKNAILLVSEQIKIQLFVDALDEAGDKEAVSLLRFFLHLARDAGGQLKICVSSRHYPLTGIAHDLEIIVENNNAKDIATYVRAELKEGLREQSKIHEIHRAILHQASGVFQWALLVLPRVIRSCNHGSKTATTLNLIFEIPQELELLYQSLFRDVTGREKVLVLRLMRWVCFSLEPLSLTELRHVMVIESVPGTFTIAALEASDDFKETDDGMRLWAIHLSRGLVAIRLRRETKEWIVQPNHHSVQEFVSSGGLSWLSDTVAQDEVGAANYAMLKSSIRYMAAEEVFSIFAHLAQAIDSSTKEWFAGPMTITIDGKLNLGHLPNSRVEIQSAMFSKFPAVRYASHNWTAHAQQTDQSSYGVCLREINKLFQWPSSRLTFLCSVIVDPAYRETVTLWKYQSLLHIASDHGIFHMVQGLLCEDTLACLNIGDGRMKFTPLELAVSKGYTSIVQLLLNTGVIDRSNLEPLYVAASKGYLDTTILLLQGLGISGDTPSSRGAVLRALSSAASSGQACVVRYLLDRFPDIKPKDGEWSALASAAEQGREDMVILLLKTERASVNVVDNGGYTPLHRAVRRNFHRIVKILLHIDATAVHSRNRDGDIPLHLALVNQDLNMVQLLLDNDADPMTRDNKGNTFLHLAILSIWHKDLLPDANKLLLHMGRIAVDAENWQNETPLQLAAKNRRPEFMQALLDMNADKEVRDYQGETLLHHVVRPKDWHLSDTRATEVLLNIEEIDVDAKSRRGQTPLHVAASEGFSEDMLLLLERGGDPEARDDEGNTPLHYAAQERLYEDPLLDAVAALLSIDRVDLDARNACGQTPLHFAAGMSSPKVMQLLLHRGAGPGIQDNMGRTPLHAAVLENRPNNIKILLETEGVMVNAKTMDGQTPLHLTAENGHSWMTTLLIDNGAALDIRDIFGCKPLHLAAENGHSETLKLLLDLGASPDAKDSPGSETGTRDEDALSSASCDEWEDYDSSVSELEDDNEVGSESDIKDGAGHSEPEPGLHDEDDSKENSGDEVNVSGVPFDGNNKM